MKTSKTQRIIILSILIDHSSFNSNWAEWEFRYIYGSEAAKHTFLCQPGTSIRHPQGSAPYIYRPINLYWSQGLGEIHQWDTWYINFSGSQ
jgi:hypothetical protein